jgi:hypothetical protein
MLFTNVNHIDEKLVVYGVKPGNESVAAVIYIFCFCVFCPFFSVLLTLATICRYDVNSTPMTVKTSSAVIVHSLQRENPREPNYYYP